MTILAALCSGVLVGFVITVVIHDRLQERRGPDHLNEHTETWGPSSVAADTLARQRRTDRANAIAESVRGAFEAYPFATTAAQIDALETTEERA